MTLLKPEVGQIVYTRDKTDCCYCSKLPPDTKVEITAVDPPHRKPVRGIAVERVDGGLRWWHCTRCLRRPRKGEARK